MKNIILLLCLIPILGYAQSEEYIRIGGTNLLMLPPQGFEPSTNYKGFQNSENAYAMIMVVEIPGPYSEIIKGFSKDVMKERGMVLKSRDKIDISDYQGLIIEMEQEANGAVFSKAIVIYGNEENSTIVNGMCLKEDSELYPLIYEAVINVRLDESLGADPRSELDFTVNEGLIDLQFIGAVGNGMLFNRDGKIPTKSEDQLNVFIDKSYATFIADDHKAFSLKRLNEYDDSYLLDEEKGLQNIEIDGIAGVSLFAINEDRDGEIMRQVLLFPDDGGYYILNATFQDGYDQTISDVDLFLNSFKIK